MAMVAPIGVCADTNFPTPPRKSLEDLNCAAFAAQQNTIFRICAAPNRVVTVKLDEVRVAQEPPPRPGKPPLPDAGNEKFSLIFSGTRGDLLEQETYVFEHEILGRMSFFIVPVFTRNPEKIDYEAVINRARGGRFAGNQTVSDGSLPGTQSTARNQT